MKYVRIEDVAVKRLPGEVTVWVPMALLVSDEETSRGVDAVYVYCSLFTLFENPDHVRILSSFRDLLPGFEGKQLVIAPPLPAERCSRHEVALSLEKLVAHARLLRQADFRTPSPLRLALSHVLSPVRWVVGDTRGVEESVASRVASQIIEEIASEIAKALATRRWEEGYVLHSVELRTGSVYYAIGNKVSRNVVLSRALGADHSARKAIERLKDSGFGPGAAP